MNIEIEKALAFDSLAEAEKITGIDYHQDDGAVALGMLIGMKHSEKKAKLLRENKDTCMRNNLTQQLEVIEDMGFRLLCCGDIVGTDDKWRIYWRDGVLLFCDSYYGDKSMNSGNAYFNYCGPRDAMRRCSNGHVGEIDGKPVWSGHVDIREGLRHALESMSEAGEILPKWMKMPFLWLLSYKDAKEPGYDYRQINAERISMLPADAQWVINGNEDQ